MGSLPQWSRKASLCASRTALAEFGIHGHELKVRAEDRLRQWRVQRPVHRRSSGPPRNRASGEERRLVLVLLLVVDPQPGCDAGAAHGGVLRKALPRTWPQSHPSSAEPTPRRCHRGSTQPKPYDLSLDVFLGTRCVRPWDTLRIKSQHGVVLLGGFFRDSISCSRSGRCSNHTGFSTAAVRAMSAAHASRSRAPALLHRSPGKSTVQPAATSDRVMGTG